MRNVKKYLLRWFKNIIYGKIPHREELPIFVDYGQLNSTSVLDSLNKACMTLAI